MKRKQYPNEVIWKPVQKRIYTKRKAPETRAMPFERAYRKLSTDDKNIAREIIMKRCKIENQTHFIAMKRGKETISIERQDVIISVFQAYGLNAWTGEPFYSSEP